ncbi:MAG: hypothetical protein JO036_15825 [Candidatus Eremiobacteraeota bacterium]|nr:hypothetical protein [Candidatus Eremiobacteraeota bacterium]
MPVPEAVGSEGSDIARRVPGRVPAGAGSGMERDGGAPRGAFGSLERCCIARRRTAAIAWSSSSGRNIGGPATGMPCARTPGTVFGRSALSENGEGFTRTGSLTGTRCGGVASATVTLGSAWCGEDANETSPAVGASRTSAATNATARRNRPCIGQAP